MEMAKIEMAKKADGQDECFPVSIVGTYGVSEDPEENEHIIHDLPKLTDGNGEEYTLPIQMMCGLPGHEFSVKIAVYAGAPVDHECLAKSIEEVFDVASKAIRNLMNEGCRK